MRRNHIVSIIVLCCTLFAVIAPFSGSVNLTNFAQLTSMFWWGAWLSTGFEDDYGFNTIDLSLGLIALTILATVGSHSLARSGVFLLAGGLVWLASRIQFGDRITRRLGDISYGVYIFGFPTQQSLVAVFGPTTFSYIEYLAMTAAITFPLALLSWHLVEKRFIRLKNLFSGGESSAATPWSNS